jgi:hypothetical protein
LALSTGGYPIEIRGLNWLFVPASSFTPPMGALQVAPWSSEPDLDVGVVALLGLLARDGIGVLALNRRQSGERTGG